MTVVDTSVFVDALFRFNEERSSVAGSVFEVLQEHRITILEPEIFKIELIGTTCQEDSKTRSNRTL